MSESRNGESRGSVYTPRYPAYGSNPNACESRNERSRLVSPSKSTPSRKGELRREPISNQKPDYNNLDNIDALIERLEKEIPKNSSVSHKVNDAYASRLRKIEELKALQRQAKEEQARQRRIAEAEEQLPKIQQGNDELDEAIAQVKQMVKKYEPVIETRSYAYWDDGESHDGESRW